MKLAGTEGQDRVLEPRPFWRRGAVRVAVGASALLAVGFVLLLRHFAGVSGSIDRGRLVLARVERGSFVRDIAADGQVVAAVSPTLYAPAAGTVSLYVRAGDRVARGQALAAVDSPELKARLLQEQATLTGERNEWQRTEREAAQKLLGLQATLEQARVDEDTAQRELARSRKAFELGAYSELQALRAQDALEKSQFALRQAQRNYEAQPEQNRFELASRQSQVERQRLLVEELARQVADLEVRSPVDGQIGQVQVVDRASVTRDTPLLSVVDLSALEVEIRVAESFAHDLRPGMTGEIQGNGRSWNATVSGVSPEVVGGQVGARLRFDGERPEGLRQSQHLQVRILLDEHRNVLMLDRGPFLDQDGDAMVYVVEGNLAIRRQVRFGAASLSKVEVLDGLQAGEQVVIAGTDAFRSAERIALSH